MHVWIEQPTHMGSNALHAQQTANEKHWGQMGQPSGSSGYGRGQGEQGFNVKGDGTDLAGGDTYGVARLTPTEKANALAHSKKMPVFNSRSGCADRGKRKPTVNHDRHLFRALILLRCSAGWNANPFDQPVESARYNKLPNYMFDHLLSGAADCVKGCAGGCMAPSF